MNLTVNLWSKRAGDLKSFLESYYGRQMDIKENEAAWACELRKPLEAVDIISAVIDNSDRYQIIIYIQFGDGHIYHVTPENHNNVIKDIIMLFYNKSVLYYN